ncbi:MAG TPA: hypothetical protein VGG11_12815 [Xanthobacteraceae bacterium]|jgi:hypothetical protein
MSSALTKDTAIWTLISMVLGSFVCGILLMVGLRNYFQNDAILLYVFLFLIFPLHIFSCIVNGRRLVRVIP